MCFYMLKPTGCVPFLQDSSSVTGAGIYVSLTEGLGFMK